MKKYLMCLSFLIFLVLFVVFGIVNSQVSNSKDVLIKFAETLKEKNMDSLIPFVTNEPEYVRKKWTEEFRKVYNYPEKKAGDSNSEADKSGFSPVPRQYSGAELVKEIVPTDLFFEQNRYLKEIVSFKEKDKEARTRVKFGGWDSKDGEQFGDEEFDILLYKEDDGWKIFKVLFPKQNEKYDIYKFYAVADDH